MCEEFLIRVVDLDNVADIWTYVPQYPLPLLQNFLLGFVGKKLTAIDSKVLLRFDSDLVGLLLEHTVIVTTELKVLAILVQWLQFNFKCREKYTAEFLALIFWDRIHSRDVRGIAVKCLKPLKTAIMEASKKPCPITPRGMLPGMILVGGFSIDGPMNNARFLPNNCGLSMKDSKWVTFAPLPTEARTVDFGLCPLPDGGFIIAGGCTLNSGMGDAPSRTSFMFDAHAKRWRRLKDMKRERSLCLAVWFRYDDRATNLRLQH